MSEPMFPSAESGAAAPAGTAPVGEPGGGSKKLLLALGGIGAAVVVGGAAFFLLSSGGSSDPSASAPIAPVPVPAASASPSVAVKPVVIRPATTVTSRDPFKPLFAAAVASGGGAAVTTGGTTSTPVTTGGGGTTTTPGSGAGGKSVTLSVSTIDPIAGTATVTVDKKKYATGVGKTFGQYFTVYSVFNDQCVGILYGDQSIPVCVSKPQTVSP